MKAYRLVGILVCLVISTAALVGCNGGESSEPDQTTVTPIPAAVEEPTATADTPLSSDSDTVAADEQGSVAEVPETTDEEEPPAEESEPVEEEEPSQAEGGDEDAGAPPEPAISVPEGVSLIACPDPKSTLILKFSANIEITAQEAVISHILHDGILSLSVVAGDDGTVGITTLASEPIPYEMNGVMRDCTLEGGGTMTPSATGFCQDGVVYLTIVEDWSPYEGTLTCPDAVMPMSAPSMGQQTHAGADGMGEVFFLDANFGQEGAGYTSIRPFAGPMGQGDHIWTLFYEYTGPVSP